MLNEQIYID